MARRHCSRLALGNARPNADKNAYILHTAPATDLTRSCSHPFMPNPCNPAHTSFGHRPRRKQYGF